MNSKGNHLIHGVISTVFYEQNTAMVMTLPYACHSVKKTEIEAHFGDRIVDLNVDISRASEYHKANVCAPQFASG